MPVVRVEDVTFRYRGFHTPAVQGLNLEVEEGDFVLLTGPSGSGKSTVLRLLNGLIPHFHEGPLDGEVVVFGLDTRQVRPNRLSTRVGTVFQFPEEQIVASRVWRDVAFGLENLRLPKDEILARVDRALAFVDLDGLRGREVATLSGGEKQRLALASVLAMEPSLLLLDEPAAELDPQARFEFVTLLGRLKADAARTLVVADHRLEDLAPLATRVVVLDRGRKVLEGPPEEVLLQDLLPELGVEVPLPVRVWKRLRPKGPGRGPTPLTLDALADALDTRRDLLGG